MAMSVTSLKRSGEIDYEAMITARLDRRSWFQPTLLVRCTEENGVSTLFIVQKKGIQRFDTLEKFTVYTMRIKGCCVENNDMGFKVGVPGPFQVKIQCWCDIYKCSKAWSLQLQYEITPFTDLQQRSVDTYCDVIGRLLGKASPALSTSLPKLILTLMADGVKQDVECLGDHASIAANVGDVVAIKNAVIKKYKGERRLQTALLSVIEINPKQSESLPAITPLSDFENESPHKVRKMELKPLVANDYASQVTIDHANLMLKKMVADVKAGKEGAPLHFVLRCKIHQLDNDFFTNNAPFVGYSDAETVRWQTQVSDMTGAMCVVIWTSAAVSLLEVSPSRLRTIWEDGDRNESNRADLLKALNAKLDKYFLLRCTAKLWNDTVDVNVNSAVEIVVLDFGADQDLNEKHRAVLPKTLSANLEKYS